MTTLVLTVIGRDRPGLVDALSGVIAEHGGNWEASRMAHLADKFAGIVLVHVPDAEAHALVDAFHGLEREDWLHITAEPAAGPSSEPARRILTLSLVGQDHPGIVHDLAGALAARGVSIEELATDTRSASMSGGTLFHATARLSAPAELPLDDLRARLESLANEILVDIDLDVDETGG
jgi:glycine cleavage system regulatory protein